MFGRACGRLPTLLRGRAAPVVAASLVGGGAFACCEPKAKKKGAKDDMPLITLDELRKHTSEDDLWVAYAGTVYDISDFIKGHPGGHDRLLMAAGQSMEPYWDIYTEHYRGHVIPFLDRFKIGRLSAADAKEAANFEFTNPYADDPERHPDLLHCTTHPFNGECRLDRLTENFYTPNELHYVRNHLPVPDIDDDDYELEVSGVGVKTTTFSLNDLKTKFKKIEVTNCLQCAGNRREDFHGNKGRDQQIFISPHWIVGAFSNAKWGGCRMRDVLKYCGLDVDAMSLGQLDPHDLGIKHACFEGYDATETGMTYGGSVPIDKVLDPLGDTIVAYEMNGVPVPPDHGKPCRALMPGQFGCRNCKWLHKIILSPTESTKPWQDKSYLGFAPDVRFEADPEVAPGKALWKWTKDPALKAHLEYGQNVTHGHLGRVIGQIQPVTSMICNPAQATIIGGNPDFVEIKGVAHSFGGSGLNRVDVSIDGGKNWTMADMYKPDDLLKKERYMKMWSWNLFTKKVPLSPDHKAQLKAGRKLELELVSKAVDTHFNVQPEYPDSYYNPRGIVINHMYRVPLTIDPVVNRAEREQKELKELRNNYYKPCPAVTPKGRTGQEFPNKPTGGLFKEPWVHDIKA